MANMYASIASTLSRRKIFIQGVARVLVSKPFDAGHADRDQRRTLHAGAYELRILIKGGRLREGYRFLRTLSCKQG